ncbi:hypothetical protein [Endozoicomonas lisbonensis]|uniref:hypothetical protein n=1 Tax=Endozoicomonas lisbonensis TaxID=3120522 RepID=UPI0033945310
MTLAALHQELIPAPIPMSIFMRWWSLYQADPSVFPGNNPSVQPTRPMTKPQTMEQQLAMFEAAL